jgi:cytochrome c-type biogenesis protein CcmH/NrfF
MKATTKILALAAVVSLAVVLGQWGGAPAYAQQTDRAKRLGGRLMCMCNCNQVLTACNHVGCSTSTAMLKKMDLLVARNDSDDLTIQAFVQEWGEKVLAEPPAKGFNFVAWLIPGVAFGIGFVIVLLVIHHWRRRVTLTPATPTGPAVSPELLARARQQANDETED